MLECIYWKIGTPTPPANPHPGGENVPLGAGVLKKGEMKRGEMRKKGRKRKDRKNTKENGEKIQGEKHSRS